MEQVQAEASPQRQLSLDATAVLLLLHAHAAAWRAAAAANAAAAVPPTATGPVLPPSISWLTPGGWANRFTVNSPTWGLKMLGKEVFFWGGGNFWATQEIGLR